MITRTNEWKTLTKHISCDCKCKFDGRKCNSNQKGNKDLCWCDWKNLTKDHVCKKDYVWNPSTCACKIKRYLTSIADDLVITCD